MELIWERNPTGSYLCVMSVTVIAKLYIQQKGGRQENE